MHLRENKTRVRGFVILFKKNKQWFAFNWNYSTKPLEMLSHSHVEIYGTGYRHTALKKARVVKKVLLKHLEEQGFKTKSSNVKIKVFKVTDDKLPIDIDFKSFWKTIGQLKLEKGHKASVWSPWFIPFKVKK